MGAAIETARSWPGVDYVGLSVSVRSQAALRLYQRLGFVVWGTEPDVARVGGTDYDEVHLALRLD